MSTITCFISKLNKTPNIREKSDIYAHVISVIFCILSLGSTCLNIIFLADIALKLEILVHHGLRLLQEDVIITMIFF